MLERRKERTSLHAGRSSGKDHWIGAGAGKSGLAFNYVIRTRDAQVELYIDQGETEVNKYIFDQLFTRKEQIEEAFGDPFDWQRPDEWRTCRIRRVIPGGGLRDWGRWPEIQEAMIDTMVRLEKALKPRIRRLK